MSYTVFAKFEFDPSKSKSNFDKHGIDFIDAQKLWEQPVVRLLSKVPGELRELVIGNIDSKYWTAIIAQRDGAIRLISCRRSRDEEKKLYEKITHNR
jgi:hypothetical protein